MKTIKLLLALSIVTMPTLPTISVHATDVDINTEEKNPDVEVEEKNPDVEVEEKDPDDEVANTETNLGRTNNLWTDSTNITYRYNTNTLTATVIRYIGSATQLTIPPTITVGNRTFVVNSIGTAAFEFSEVESYELPDTLLTIENRAFRSNSLLSQIVIPNSVTSIGNNAFENCTELRSVKLGNSLTTIGQYSFSNGNLINIEIPNSVQSIGEAAFYNNNLTSVTLPNSITSIERFTFSNNLLTTVTLPNSLKTIGDEAFRNNQLQNITLPNEVTSIGSNAFNNNMIINVVIPNSVTSIGASAFANNKLKSATLPRDITSIPGSLFSHNELTSITIPNTVTSIGNSAFSNNSLSSVNIPNSVTTIGNSAFSHNNLREATLPNSVTSIGNNAFRDNQLHHITIPNSITTIQYYTFFDNNLTSITLPNSLTTIEYNAFDNNNLTSVALPNSITTIGNHAFRNNQLHHITLPNSITSIGEYAFNNNNLTSVSIPNSITTIEGHVFGNNEISSVDIPRSVKTLGDYAFQDNKIKSVFIPDSVTSIGHSVFQHNPLQTIQTNDGNADLLKSRLTNMGTLDIPKVTLIEISPTGYEPGVQLVNNLFINSDFKLSIVSQTKYEYTNSTGTWNAYVPVVQWYHNGNLLAGKNDVTLSLSNIQESDAGVYHALVDSTVLPNITVNVTKGSPLSEIFPDENFAKAIAEVLRGNQDINVFVSLEELAGIEYLNFNNKGIENLTGVEYLVNLTALMLNNNKIQDVTPLTKISKLQFLLLNNNHISNIKPLSSNILFEATNQTIQLPEGLRREPTEIKLVDRDGSTPSITFNKGEGTFTNGKLTWVTIGENQLTWRGSTQFTGTITQPVVDRHHPISTMFPDENLAKEIAQALNGNQSINTLTTETELEKINNLNIEQKGIKDLTGLDYLINLVDINGNRNHITDVSIISKLPNIKFYTFANQTIELPQGIRGVSTDIPLVNVNGSTPSINFILGDGNYTNGKLTWSTVGDNQLTWQGTGFSGRIMQHITPSLNESIAAIFPDQNLAKAIANRLNGNDDTSAIVTEAELLSIDRLAVSNSGIKNLSGVERLRSLVALDVSGNHIQDISMLLPLPNLFILMASDQVITLPEVTLGTPTKLTILNEYGATPNHTFTIGEGTYINGELQWTTVGENQLTWQSSLIGTFSGKVIQNVVQPKVTIASMFPDVNFAQAIAIALHNNTDTSVEVTEQELASITHISVPNSNIRSISGIENLQNLMFISAEGNQITDISMLSQLPKLTLFYIANQSITLSDVAIGVPTQVILLNHNGTVPQYEFTAGQGSYNNGTLIWNTAGVNTLNWNQTTPSGGIFNGIITQNTKQRI
jgi:hypothetical protein